MKYLIVLFFISGCVSANWVRKNYEPRGGTLSYLNQGADGIIDSRREDAINKIKLFCTPNNFKLISESNSSTDSGSIATYNQQFNYVQSYNTSQEYTYLNFKCLD